MTPMAKIVPPPTPPTDCALAVCIPLTYDKFASDLLNPHKDFAKSVIREFPSHCPEAVWSAVVEPELSSLFEVMDRVRELGVNVRTDCTFRETVGLISQFRVVTILSHWRSGWLYVDEIVNAQNVIAKLKTVALPGIKQLTFLLDSAETHRTPTADVLSSVCVGINQALSQENLEPSKYPAGWHISAKELYRVHANRAVLDDLLAHDILRGNMAEFSDGMQSPADIASAIPDISGHVLDFTICNSIMLSEEIKLHKNITCVASEDPIELGLRSELYLEAIRIISECPYEYTEAMRDLRISMAEEIKRRRKGFWRWLH